MEKLFVVFHFLSEHFEYGGNRKTQFLRCSAFYVYFH